MHLHFEKNSITKCDCTILSVSWMGKVPEEELPEDEGWKLNRTNYYQEGWLATGNTRGIVGVTFSTSHCKKNVEFPQRTNYNLRGHRSDVILVKWNEPYQKLATCDSSGIIFVWIKYEGRWSVELINDRNTPVTHFSWSHDGRMALITYQDGFVLVGSVAGQRYWSSMLNLDATITCGIWTPDDQQVYFGTTSGEIIVMNVHGAMVSQVSLSEYGITSMSWSCEKFKMEEGDTEPGVKNASIRSFVLAVSFKNGLIYLLKSFDDLSPFLINTNFAEGYCVEWSNSRELLAVAGTEIDSRFHKKDVKYLNNCIKFYTETGQLLYTTKLPNSNSPVTALTWGHNDKRIFIATGNQIHIAWVSRRIASLQLLCRLKIQQSLLIEEHLNELPLPLKLKNNIGNLFAQTIRCGIPDMKHLRDFVSRPPQNGRLHCTIIRHDEDANQSSGTCYTLYLEFLGGLIPLLKGKRTSKIRPEFVIFDPQDESFSVSQTHSTSDASKSLSSSSTSGSGEKNLEYDSSEYGSDDENVFRKTHRKRKHKSETKHTDLLVENNFSGSENNEITTDELTYIDTLPEHLKLVEVTSNIWGTKFKIHGIAKSILPANLGQVTYKTSLLHLQPRQMTLVITELRDDFPIMPDPSFNPNIFSEDEEDYNVKSSRNIHRNREHNNSSNSNSGHLLLIAPMSPRPKNRFSSHSNSQRPSISYCNNNPPISSTSSSSSSSANIPSTSKTPPRSLGPLAKAESYDDDLFETPVVPTKNIINYSNIISYGHNRSMPSSSNNQSRVAISPLYCEQSLPTLQSPKNAVAPSDIIFERPPAGQTSIMNFSSNLDCLSSISHVKSALSSENSRQNTNPLPINLNLNVEKSNNEGKSLQNFFAKKKSIEYIDDEPTPTSTSSHLDPPSISGMRSRKSIPNMIPDILTRSCSVGYLDNVELVPGDVTLSQLRNEATKRLVLVDRKINSSRKIRKNNLRRTNEIQSNGKYKNLKKSISLDSYDIFQNIPSLNKDLNNLFSQMPKLTESSENNTEDTENSSTELAITKTKKPKKTPKEKIYSIFSPRSTPILGRKNQNSKNNNKQNENTADVSIQVDIKKKSLLSKWRKSNDEQNEDQGECSKNIRERKKNRNFEIITSFTDSPLFSRKYRSSKNEIPNNGSRSQLQSEQNTPILGRRNMNRNEITTEPKAITTLENIISRLRDLDDEKVEGSSSNIRSSPSSPGPSKAKKNQHMSPIRNILNSPLLNRRKAKKTQIDTSDEDGNDDEHPNTHGSKSSYHDLETFQKAQLRQKLKRGKIEPNGTSNIPCIPVRREFVMYNKAPMWNENSQVYQLDFGGRVTQESAKNFQIEFRGKQVMQFGRISLNAYTLDFEYPFSALQAFSVALANVTQRLK